MGAFQLYTGNRLENLSAVLAETLRIPLSSPMVPEVFVVQSSGMARWVSMEIARHLGICANIRFYYPNEFVGEILGNVLVEEVGESSFEPEIMTWRIMNLLPTLVSEPGFEPLRNYIGEKKNDVKALQLSARIADLLDQYTLFRPEMIFDWESGKEDHWQAVLWRALSRDAQDSHRPALLRKFRKALGSGTVAAERIPARVSVFGVSALPRFHVEVLALIAQVAEVNLFVMNPCEEYWGDVLSNREIKRAVVKASAGNIPRELLHLDQGNPLLAALGTLGRDFMELIQFRGIEQQSFFTEPGQDSLLHSIQSDILHLRAPAQDPIHGKREIPAGDDSIGLHACHSPMREIEILHDHLLDWFEKDPDLQPGDILVMMPDIETYGPYIQAVLDTPEEEGRRIPYSIADRSLQSESIMITAFLGLIDLFKSRFGLGEVMAILEYEPVRNRFGLKKRDFNLILKWVGETNIRWGIDGRHRAGFGLPETTENTWQAGLERMLLGYAMAGEDRHLFNGRLPYDPMEGDQTLVLGKLAEFIQVVTRAAGDFAQPKTLLHWAEVLSQLLDAVFLADDESENEIQSIRAHVNRLEEIARLSSFHQAVPMDVIRHHLSEQFGKKGFGFGFITGGVTFCAMVPMRSIPFKIICLLGMDSNAYPRETRRIGFDLMAADPRPGDRSRRIDDQYLFLEALMSARQRLYISYVGQSIRDNSLSPPSVLVSDLMDYISAGFAWPGKPIDEQLHLRHRLQAFSPAYFLPVWEKAEDGPTGKLFSYSLENKTAATLLLSQREPPRPFLANALPPPEEIFRSITLDDLCRFFSNPARYWMQERLGIAFDAGEDVLEEREPFTVAGLARYSLDRQLMDKTLRSGLSGEMKAVIRTLGVLPHGAVGECCLEKLSIEAHEFTQKVRPFMGTEKRSPLLVEIALDGFRLSGEMDGIYTEHLLRWRYARIKPGDILSAWITHLFLNQIRPEGYPRKTVLLGLKGDSRSKSRPWLWSFAEVGNSRAILGELLEIYWQGLRRPLHFFPAAAMVYFETLTHEAKTEEQALAKAGTEWEGGEYKSGEKDDPYYRRCFKDEEVLDDDFTTMARNIFKPLWEHLTESACDEHL